MQNLIIWYCPKKNIYYYKVVKNAYQNYYVGFKNQYNHIVVLVIPLSTFCSCYKKISFPHKVLKRFISFLQNIDKKL